MLFAEGYPEIKGVCVSLSMDFCSGFFACKYGLGVWSVRMNNQEVQEWNRRKMGFWLLTAFVVGNMVGSGIFSLPSTLAKSRARSAPHRHGF